MVTCIFTGYFYSFVNKNQSSTLHWCFKWIISGILNVLFKNSYTVLFSKPLLLTCSLAKCAGVVIQLDSAMRINKFNLNMDICNRIFPALGHENCLIGFDDPMLAQFYYKYSCSDWIYYSHSTVQLANPTSKFRYWCIAYKKNPAKNTVTRQRSQ